MGEVYRATDTQLKRQVAIKVLPASMAADAERLARFHREAEVLATLNHPNIALKVRDYPVRSTAEVSMPWRWRSARRAGRSAEQR